MRVLCRVVSLTDDTVNVGAIGVGLFALDRSVLPEELNNCLDIDYRFHADATIFHGEIQSISNFEWDGCTLEQQEKMIDSALYKIRNGRNKS